MLQQTQAARVADRYPRFLGDFPTVEVLAAATPAAVMAAWQGLGYNRRAFRLQEAARRIATDGWPAGLEGLEALPGVGPYTAAAVACFALGMGVPALDTNARRVLSRWHGRPLSGAALSTAAHQDLPPAAADWNQAVMDLGAAVCTPRQPACDRCPVAAWCTDPSVYEPPRRQGRFEGSLREARGAVIRHLVSQSSATVEEIAERSGLPADRIGGAVDSLRADRMITATGSDAITLPDGGSA
ncbi:MAG: A/G-specific adenine glycosylase [Actinobacteria bacterium]|nr:A/G-specific adenine glycosylase [Actinomycetota bacterium]MBU1492669.1 A/G-specific adenine glycosylase [Actinomycetota bacterium]MBU1865800.1 A/G-specific adenine glycosylase [Actinomycetota bacterium]